VRLRANLSLGSLPDVRDNYIKYHSANCRRNKLLDFARKGPNADLYALDSIVTVRTRHAIKTALRGTFRSARYTHSSTLSSSFFFPQSAAACTNARTSG
jgi:hypothetical protein